MSPRARRGVFAWQLAAFALTACKGSAHFGGQPGDPQIARFESDRATYYVGERARLTATCIGGTGRIEPGSIPIASGQTVETPVLSGSRTFRLIVSAGDRTTQRDRALDLRYSERTRTLATPFGRAEHVTAVLDDGSVLIAGGGGGGGGLQSGAQLFDPATERFTPIQSAFTARYSHTATRLPDGRVLIYGGYPVAGGLATLPVAIYEPAANRFVMLPSLEAGQRGLHAAVGAADGRVWIRGGEDADGTPLVANGKVLIVGGLNANRQIVSSAEIFE